MEQVLGRFLDRKECIHHINGDTLDNRPENLMLFPTSGRHVAFHLKLKSSNQSL
jgi:hypothetical protein